MENCSNARGCFCTGYVHLCRKYCCCNIVPWCRQTKNRSWRRLCASNKLKCWQNVTNEWLRKSYESTWRGASLTRAEPEPVGGRFDTCSGFSPVSEKRFDEGLPWSYGKCKIYYNTQINYLRFLHFWILLSMNSKIRFLRCNIPKIKNIAIEKALHVKDPFTHMPNLRSITKYLPNLVG